MSPTEFSNYIKQRAMQQQQQQQMHHHPVGHHHLPPPSQLSPQGPHRSLSPSLLNDPGSFFFPPQYQQHQQHFGRGMYDSSSHGPSPFLDMYSSNKGYSSFVDHNGYYSGSGFGSGTPTPGPIGSGLSAASSASSGAGSTGGSHSPGVIGGGVGSSASSSSSLGGVGSAGGSGQTQAEKQLLDGFSNFSLSPHPSNSQYQHLLVAN